MAGRGKARRGMAGRGLAGLGVARSGRAGHGIKMSHPPEWYEKWKPPKLSHGKLTRWNWLVLFPQNLKLGKYTDIGAFALIHAGAVVEIEDYVQIGSHCSILSVSTIDGKKGKVVLKKGCKIGSHSVVMPNTIIGEGSIVAANSLVNRDIPPNEVWGGAPAKPISPRSA